MRLRKIFLFLLFVPAVIPLIYIGGIIYPYISPKTFLLQGSGIIALAIFVFLALAGQVFFYGRLRAPLTWIPALLLFVAYITSFLGIDFYRSFWGIFARGDGLLTLSVITIFFYLILLSADSEFLKRLAKVITVVAGIVAAIAVLQWITTIFGGKAAFLPPVTGRIGSTIGNAAFLAGYLGMAFFVILALLRDSNNFWRRICKIAAILSVLAIVLTATRGTILALLVSLVIVLVFAALKGDEKIKRGAKYGIAALVIFAGLFFVFRAELSQSSFEPVRRVASISLSDGTVSSRLFVWSHITEEAIKHPFSGYGSEHITQLFDKVYDPSKIVEQWFDRSHNAFLDYFVQYGIFGLALYLAFIVAFVVYALRIYRREDFSIMNYGFIFLLLILTYVVQNLFVFDTPSSLWLLYALFALLIVWISDTSATKISLHIPKVVSGIISVIIVLIIIPTIILPLYSNILLTKGYLYHLIDVKKANAYFEKGFALHTYADLEYGYQAYEMYTGHQEPSLTGENRIAAYNYALSVLTANYNKYPYDARTATYLGHIIDTAPPEITVDDVFDQQVLSRAMELSPLRAQVWYLTANISLRNSDFRKAISIIEDYSQKEPKLPEPRFILANLYYKMGDTATAKKLADEALHLYITNPDIGAASPALKYYLAIGDWQNATRFLADLVANNPSDYDVLYDLAKVTYMAGDPAAAERIVAQLRQSNPAILETDQNFLSAITTYEQLQK